MSTITTVKTIACGNRQAHSFVPGHQDHHYSVAEVRRCFATPGGILSIEEADQAAALDTYDPDLAYERHLESAGYFEARAQEDHEAAMGLLTFEQAALEAALEAAQPLAEVFEVVAPSTPMLDGIYTLEREGGHRTFRLRTQKPDSDFMPGVQVVAFLSGPDNSSDYTNFGHVTSSQTVKVWKRHRANSALTHDLQVFLADPEAALVAGHCYRCHRLLTTPESLAVGLGPECAAKSAGL